MKRLKPGIFPDLSIKDYHADKNVVSKSGLFTIIDKSPQFFYYENFVEKEETRPMAVGQALHTMVFEPEKFETEIAVEPKVNKRTKDGRAEIAKFFEDNDDKTVITYDEYDIVEAAANAVWHHPRAGAMVRDASGVAERSIVVEDPETGFLVKARVDWHIERLNLMVDLKSTISAHPAAFSRQIHQMGYYMQAGMYQHVGRLAGFKVDGFSFIAVEKKPPYAVAVYNADKEMLKLGLDAFDRAMKIYVKCMSTGEWPGYNNDMVTKISLPRYAAAALNQSL